MIFQYENYKEFIKYQIEKNKGQKAYKGQLAEAAQCQRSVISQVLNNDWTHFSLEQASALCSFWSLSDLETDYFLQSVSYQRAGTDQLRKFFMSKMNEIKSSFYDLENRFNEKKLSSLSQQALYYGHWKYTAIHVLLSIKGFNNIDSISKKLNINLSEVEQVLIDLQKMNLAMCNEIGWFQKESFLHLPKTSPMTLVNHSNSRQKAIEQIQKNTSENLFFTSSFSCSKQGFEKIKNILHKCLDDIREEVKQEEPEELYCFNFDLFQY